MKRILKWAMRILLVLVLVPVVALLCVWGYYKSVVSPKSAKPVEEWLGVASKGYHAARYVDPFIGTGGFPWMCALDTPAATTPFGMIRLGPDTAAIWTNKNGNNRSGYFYGDNKIIGFSHTRLVGADSHEGGIFRVFPTTESHVEAARRGNGFAKFSHKNEGAGTGYYAVELPRDRVLVELTATPRVGVHRYTFKGNEKPHLLVDVTSALGDKHCKMGLVKVLPDTNELEGSVREFGSFSGRYDGLDAYFVARFGKPFASYGTWDAKGFAAGDAVSAGERIGVDVGFDRGKDSGRAFVVELRVGISYVSVANARMNLEAEAASKSFDDVMTSAGTAWDRVLSRIDIDPPDLVFLSGSDQAWKQRNREIFYTSLYHTVEMPTIFTDVNGEYRGFDKQVHKAEGFQYYTDMSLWDTFRTVHPLYNLIARDEQRDMMVSLVEMAKAGGCLPRWPSGCGYTNCMFGTPADVVVSEAYQKGICDFDVETAYGAMRATGLTGKPAGTRFAGREGLEWYLQYGYCPSDKMDESVAATMEFGWADNSISLLAKALGKTEDAELFAKHAKFYRNLWNPQSLFFETRDTQGNFPKERNPAVLTYTDFKGKYTKGYVEGSGWQWRWPAFYDPQGLISLFPSKERFVQELNGFFEKSKKQMGSWNPGAYYWHGNEPDIHAVYLFNEAGRPDLTQKWVRYILENKYSNDYVGMDGNDDGGTLSAWYVWSALGLYPVAGTTKYELGSPLFAEVRVRLDKERDKELRIVAENNSPSNVYVQRVSLNGTTLDRTWITHDEIANGGELRFVMSATPK